MAEIKLPELGEEITSAVVSCVYCKNGDQVHEGDDVVELTTDKATFNVSATQTGTVREICVKEGDTAHIGQTLLIIE